MHLGYVGFLLPIWFGWQIQGRMERALVNQTGMIGEAVVLFPVFIAVVVVTPAWWIWFHPPETTDTRMPMAFMIGVIATFTVMLSAMAHAVFHKLRS